MSESVELPEPNEVTRANKTQVVVGGHYYSSGVDLDAEIAWHKQRISDLLQVRVFLADELDELIDRARAHAHGESPAVSAHGAKFASMPPEAQKYYRALVRFIQDESK